MIQINLYLIIMKYARNIHFFSNAVRDENNTIGSNRFSGYSIAKIPPNEMAYMLKCHDFEH